MNGEWWKITLSKAHQEFQKKDDYFTAMTAFGKVFAKLFGHSVIRLCTNEVNKVDIEVNDETVTELYNLIDNITINQVPSINYTNSKPLPSSSGIEQKYNSQDNGKSNNTNDSLMKQYITLQQQMKEMEVKMKKENQDEFMYVEQVQRLVTMGFNDVDRDCMIIKQTKGDIQAAIAILISDTK